MTIITKLIILGIILVFLAIIILLIAKQYRKVGPNQALIISGGRKRAVIAPAHGSDHLEHQNPRSSHPRRSSPPG